MRIAIVGAGIYGLYAGRLLSSQSHKIEIFESSSGAMQGASLLNQARVHGGYHYPRSLRTAARSQRNYKKFVSEFCEGVSEENRALYAIARDSKISAQKFLHFTKIIDAPIALASLEDLAIFNRNLIEDVFEVKELSFDSALIRKKLIDSLPPSVTISFNQQIKSFLYDDNSQQREEIYLKTKDEIFGPYDAVINATYGQLNSPFLIQHNLEFEVCEIIHVEKPSGLSQISVTIMDGPYFSLTNWPAFADSILTHVRFTPHSRHKTFSEAQANLDLTTLKSRANLMIRDAARYIPSIEDLTVLGSKYVVKTIMQNRDFDDARPIIADIEGRILNIVGSKVDNIYDVDETVMHFVERNQN